MHWLQMAPVHYVTHCASHATEANLKTAHHANTFHWEASAGNSHDYYNAQIVMVFWLYARLKCLK